MPNFRRLLNRRLLFGFLAVASLLFGLAMLHPYPRQSLFGPTIRGEPWCVWEDALRRQVHKAEYEKTLLAKAMLWMGVKQKDKIEPNELYTADMFPLLLQLADDPDVEMRRLALSAWPWTEEFYKNESAQPVLHRRLKDVDPYCRMQAALAIYLFDPNEFVPEVLLNELHGSDIKNRVTAIDALAPMGRTHPELLPHLAKYATDSNAEVRAIVMWALQSYGKDALPILCAGLDDPAGDVRRNAAVTLGLFGPGAKKAIPALVRCMENDDEHAGWAAREALFAIDPVQFRDLDTKR